MSDRTQKGPARQQDLVQGLIEEFAGRQPFRAGSFIITIYGDAVAPRGGDLSLRSLLDLMAEVGANESLVRTAVSRLTADGWLTGRRRGRRSFYSLTEGGRGQFDEATRRIYLGEAENWKADWTVVLIPGGLGEVRDTLRKELRWLGFGQMGPGVLIHPSPNKQALKVALAESGAEDLVFVIAGESQLPQNPDLLQRLASDCWNLDDLARGYQGFLDHFRALDKALGPKVEITPLQCLLVRLLLIHEYRKIILRDPLLPLVMLPKAWVGLEAHAMCRRIYGTLVPQSEAWMSKHLEAETGSLPLPKGSFFKRFGGLPRKGRKTGD